jgi:hypothetical protein
MLLQEKAEMAAYQCIERSLFHLVDPMAVVVAEVAM